MKPTNIHISHTTILLIILFSLASIVPVSSDGCKAEYYVLDKYNVKDEARILSRIMNVSIVEYHVDDATGLRKYLLSNGIVVNTEGYGAFWFTGYKRYTKYENISLRTVERVVSRITNVLRETCGYGFRVEIAGMSSLGKRVFSGTKFIKKNKTVIGIPFRETTIYSVRVDLSLVINNVRFEPGLYIVVDFEGDIIGCGLMFPKVKDKGVTKIVDSAIAGNRIKEYLEQKYGRLSLLNMTGPVYVYISPRIHGSDKELIAPAYCTLAIYSSGVAHIYYLRLGDEEKIYESVVNPVWATPSWIIGYKNTGENKSPYKILLDSALYILTLLYTLKYNKPLPQNNK